MPFKTSVVMCSLLTDGGLRDRVPRVAARFVPECYAAPAGAPGADRHTLLVKLSLVLVRIGFSLE